MRKKTKRNATFPCITSPNQPRQVRKDLRARVNPEDPSSETAATKRMLKLLGDKYTQVGALFDG